MAALYFVVLAAAVVAMVSASTMVDLDDHIKIEPELMKQYSDECKTETGFDYEDADAKTNMDDVIKEYETKNGKCFIKCVAVKAGLVNEMGDAIFENIKKVIDLPKAIDSEETFKKCTDKMASENDSCEKVYGIEKCLKEIIAKNA